MVSHALHTVRGNHYLANLITGQLVAGLLANARPPAALEHVHPALAVWNATRYDPNVEIEVSETLPDGTPLTHDIVVDADGADVWLPDFFHEAAGRPRGDAQGDGADGGNRETTARSRRRYRSALVEEVNAGTGSGLAALTDDHPATPRTAQSCATPGCTASACAGKGQTLCWSCYNVDLQQLPPFMPVSAVLRALMPVPRVRVILLKFGNLPPEAIQALGGAPELADVWTALLSRDRSCVHPPAAVDITVAEGTFLLVPPDLYEAVCAALDARARLATGGGDSRQSSRPRRYIAVSEDKEADVHSVLGRLSPTWQVRRPRREVLIGPWPGYGYRRL